MTTHQRSLTGPASAVKSDDGLTFPRHLLHPTKSQVAQSEDAVADRIAQLDRHAEQLGRAFGIGYSSFVLNPLPTPPESIAGNGLTLLAQACAQLVHRDERISLERRSGKWGLYFTRDAAVAGRAEAKVMEASPLKDAPLDVRERFLVKSEEFFRTYLDICKERLRTMRKSVVQADKTLALLASLKLSD